jgi:hypothetical protein
MQTTVEAAGRMWVIPQEPTVGVILGLRDWIAEQEGDPFEGLKELMELLPKEEAIALVKEAREVKQQLKSFSLNCKLAQRYLTTELGMLKFTELLLRSAYPDMSDREVLAVTMAYGEKIAEEKKRKPEGNGQAPATMTGVMTA